MRTLLLLLLPLAAVAELRVVATLPDLAALATEVGGADVTVTCLARATEDPHYVDPRPSLLVPLSRADLIVLNGLELEVGWLPPLVVNARNERIRVGSSGYFDASRYLPQLLEVPSRVDRAEGDIHPGGNPHYLYDPRAMATVAYALGAKMAELDPPRADAYKRRADTFATAALAFVVEQSTRFRRLPTERRRVVPYHKSMVYLLDWLGLTAVQHVEPLPGVPPSPGHVAKVLQTMRASGVRVIIQEPYYPRQTSEQLARLAGGEVAVLPGGTAIDHRERYLDHLRHLADDLHAALAR